MWWHFLLTLFSRVDHDRQRRPVRALCSCLASVLADSILRVCRHVLFAEDWLSDAPFAMFDPDEIKELKGEPAVMHASACIARA